MIHTPYFSILRKDNLKKLLLNKLYVLDILCEVLDVLDKLGVIKENIYLSLSMLGIVAQTLN